MHHVNVDFFEIFDKRFERDQLKFHVKFEFENIDFFVNSFMTFQYFTNDKFEHDYIVNIEKKLTHFV